MATIDSMPVPAMPGDAPAARGQPPGLAYLLFAEAWERFAYYGMQSLLALYLVKQLLPGDGAPPLFFTAFRRLYGGLDGQPLASAIVGTYFACVYITPIMGGLIADRWLGRHRAVLLGAAIMTVGHFLMAFQACFLLALLAIILGSGLFKGNIASQIGALYAPRDRRRAGAFQLFYLAINGGAILAPLVIGTLAERIGWHYGFGAAGIGMMIATAIYVAGRSTLPDDPARPGRHGHIVAARLTAQDRRALAALILLLPILAVGIVPNNQIFNAYLIWGDQHLDLTVAGVRLPTSWLITLDALLGVGLLAGVALFYRRYAIRHRDPGDLAKIVIGSIFSTAGMLCLALASASAPVDGRIGLVWAVAFHLLNGIGFAHILPVSLALFTRVAPAALNGLAVGFYYLTFFLANLIVGWIGGFYTLLPGPLFWLLHAVLAAGVGLAFLLLLLWPGKSPLTD